jgi:hypothetical protein
MPETIHRGDVGTDFFATIRDQSGAVVPLTVTTVIKFRFQPPRGGLRERTGVLHTDGVDGRTKYRTIAGDLDQAGKWAVQVYVELDDGWDGHSTVRKFTVYDVVPHLRNQ